MRTEAPSRRKRICVSQGALWTNRQMYKFILLLVFSFATTNKTNLLNLDSMEKKNCNSASFHKWESTYLFGMRGNGGRGRGNL